LPHRWWHTGDDADLEVPKEPMHIFQSRVAEFVSNLDEFGDETVAIIGHGNAFQEIIGFMLNNCQIHRFR